MTMVKGERKVIREVLTSASIMTYVIQNMTYVMLIYLSAITNTNGE
jgi:hypothetical protein